MKQKLTAAVLTLLLTGSLFLTGCSSSPSTVDLMKDVKASDVQTDTALTEEALLSSTDFAVRLLKESMTDKENLLLSPLSLELALAMTHALSGLMYCKDCGTKMHIRTIHKGKNTQHVTYCSEYAKGKAKHPKCNSPHRIDVDEVMENIAEVLRKIAQYSLENKAEFEKLVKESLYKEQTEEVKKNQKRMPQITDRMEQIERVMNKLYEDLEIWIQNAMSSYQESMQKNTTP